MRLRWVPLLLAAAFGGGTVCAGEPPKAVPATEKKQELSPQLLYQFLLAEIAGKRGNLGLSVNLYRDMAQATRDPRLVRRAAEVALFARRYDLALEAARLWAELEPESAQARQMVTSLLATGASPDELAAHIARQLAAEGPNLAVALLQLNRVLARVPDKRQVLRIIEQVTTPYIGMAEAHFARALAAHVVQDLARAQGEIERALALKPEWEQAAMLRAQMLTRPEAIDFLKRFVAGQPDAGEARMLLARQLVAEKRYPEARREFTELLEHDKDGRPDPEVLYAAGVLSFQIEDFDAAERHFKRLVEAGHPEANSARLYLGQIAEDRKQWDEARHWYGEVTAGEQYLAAQLRLARTLTQQDRLDEALRHLREARTVHAEHAVRLLIGEAQLLREAGRVAEALAVLDAALAERADDPELLYESALLAEKLGKAEAFEARLRRIVQLKPDHAHAYNALGYALAERNERLDEAQRLIDKALALAPDDPFILDSKGWLLFRQGDLKAALDALRQAYTQRADPEIAAHLGEVLWNLGQKDEATRTWRDAAKASPANDVLSATIKRFLP